MFYEKEVKPLVCPVCGNTELHYVTETHKSIIARFFSLILFIANLYYIIRINLEQLVEMLGYKYEPKDNITITFVFTFVIYLVLKGYILFKESKTHIRAICPKCGRFWNVD